MLRIQFQLLVVGLVLACNTGCKVRKPGQVQQSQLLKLDAQYSGTSPQIELLIAPYRTAMSQVMQDTIAYTAHEFVKARPEGALGNLATFLVFQYADSIQPGIDMVLLNHGGFRAPLPKGAITTGHIFEWMPFDNQLVILELPDSLLDELALTIASQGGDALWMRQGAYMEITDSTGKFWNLDPKPESRSIRIGSSDYLVQGGDHYGILGRATQKWETNILIRDILLSGMCKYYGKPELAASMDPKSFIRKKED